MRSIRGLRPHPLQLLVRRWDTELSRDVLAHWLDLMSASGWIPREQILGAEAAVRVPVEYVTQKVRQDCCSAKARLDIKPCQQNGEHFDPCSSYAIRLSALSIVTNIDSDSCNRFQQRVIVCATKRFRLPAGVACQPADAAAGGGVHGAQCGAGAAAWQPHPRGPGRAGLPEHRQVEVLGID